MTDRRTILLVTTFLGLIVLGGLASVVALTLAGQGVPEVVGLVTTAALGSLASLLVSTRVDPAQLPAAESSVADATKSPAAAKPTRRKPTS